MVFLCVFFFTPSHARSKPGNFGKAGRAGILLLRTGQGQEHALPSHRVDPPPLRM